jgi:hypothetical protein
MSEPAWVPIGPAAVADVGPEVSYQEFAATVALTAITEAAAQTVVTAPAFAADGSSQYLVEFFSCVVEPPASSGNSLWLVLYLDGVSLGLFGIVKNTQATPVQLPVRLARRLTPAAGSRVFSVRGYVSTGTGNVYAGVGGVGAVVPGFLRVTKVPSAVGAGFGGLVPPTAIGTVLPASPVDGQEFILTDSLTAPTYTWHLRYMAAKASNRWVFVGGAPMKHYIAAAQGTSSAAYTNLATDGPVLPPVPVFGEYLVEYSALCSVSGGATTGLGAHLSGTLINDHQQTLSGVGFAGDHAGAFAQNSNAGGIFKLLYKTNANTATFSYRMLKATPIALGG